MTHRNRRFAGLLALAAMTAFFSEAVLASLCASPAGMASMASMAMSPESGADGGTSGVQRIACDWMGHADESGEGGEHCPLTPTSTQGCTIAASAPAHEISVAAAAVLTASDVTLDVVEPELLLTNALYHPPRA